MQLRSWMIVAIAALASAANAQPLQEIRNALAVMPTAKVPILMSEHPSTWLADCPDCILRVAEATGCVPVDFNVHPRSGVGEAWTIEDIETAVALARKVSREPVIVAAYSPYLGYENGLDPATVDLGSLRRFTAYGDTLDRLAGLDVITILDSERFRIERDEQYVALDNTHSARVDTIHNAFYDVASTWGDVDWYAGGRTLLTMTWRERRRNVDAEAFRVFEPDFWHEMVEVCINRMNAEDRLALVTCHVSCGAGFEVDGQTWNPNLKYDPQITFDTCKYLTGLGVQINLHPHPFNTPDGVRHLRACIEGVNESVNH